MLGSVTVPQPRIPLNLARHLTNPSPHHKGASAGDGSAQLHHHDWKHNPQNLSCQQLAIMDTHDNLMPWSNILICQDTPLATWIAWTQERATSFGSRAIIWEDKKGGNDHISFNAQLRKWQPTPALLPGGFHGWRSLVGYIQSVGLQRVGHDRLSFFLQFLLEKETVTHSSVLAWRIPWAEEPGRL